MTAPIKDGAIHCQIADLHRDSDHVDGLTLGSPAAKRRADIASRITIIDHHGGAAERAAERTAVRTTTGPVPGKLTFRFVPISELQRPSFDSCGRELSQSMHPPASQRVQGMFAAIDAMRTAGADVEVTIGTYNTENLLPAKLPSVAAAGATAFITDIADIAPALERLLEKNR